MELKPMRLDKQIQDAISQFNNPELLKRIKFLQQNIKRVKTINGKRAYNVYIYDDDIFYTLRKNNGVIYYYPIQYAKITL